MLRSVLREVPRPVWWLCTALGLVTLCWTMIAPLGRAPDEVGHADVVFVVADGSAFPSFDEAHISTSALKVSFSHQPGADFGSGPLWLTPENASRQGSASEERWNSADSSWINQPAQHPPLYYGLLAFVLAAARAVVGGGDSWAVADEWQGLRAFGVLLIAPLPALAWGTARQLGAPRPAALAAAAFPLAVPQLLHVGGAVNNDNLVTLLGSVLALLVARLLSGDDRWWVGVSVGATLGLALLTKTTATALVPWVAVALAWRWWREPARRTNIGVFGVLAAGGVGLVAGWWFVRNLIRYGDPNPTLSTRVFRQTPADFSPDSLWYVGHYIPSFAQRFWGHFGYFEAPVNPILAGVATVATLAAIATAWSKWQGVGAGTPVDRPSLVLLLLALPAMSMLVFAVAFDLYRTSGKTPFIQGRYVFPVIVPIAVGAGVGLARFFGRWAPLCVLAFAAIFQVHAFRIAMRAWWAEPGSSLSRSFSAMIEWSSWPVGIVVVIFAAAVASVGMTAKFLHDVSTDASDPTR